MTITGESPTASSVTVAQLLEQIRPCNELVDERAGVPWLWHGYLAAGKVTLLTSQWKSGKTTLIAHLLGRMAKGGELAGLRVTAGKAVVVSEETRANWEERSRKLGLGSHVRVLCRPFKGKPMLQEWLTLVEALVEVHADTGVDLVVIDPLASFLPGRNENLAGAMLESLMPLQQLTARGVSVLLMHHPRKGASPAGQAARGSGALAAFVDILLEMSWCGEPQSSDRRRRLLAFSRHEETRRHLVMELNLEGTEYTALPVEEDEEFSNFWHVLQMVLEDASKRLTRRQILKQWPQDYAAPNDVTLWRVLQRAVSMGRALQEGRGRRNDPYRYWLPGREDDFPPPREAGLQALQEWNQRNFVRAMEKLKKKGDR